MTPPPSVKCVQSLVFRYFRLGLRARGNLKVTIRALPREDLLVKSGYSYEGQRRTDSSAALRNDKPKSKSKDDSRSLMDDNHTGNCKSKGNNSVASPFGLRSGLRQSCICYASGLNAGLKASLYLKCKCKSKVSERSSPLDDGDNPYWVSAYFRWTLAVEWMQKTGGQRQPLVYLPEAERQNGKFGFIK